jgi:hypothetical protein
MKTISKHVKSSFILLLMIMGLLFSQSCSKDESVTDPIENGNTNGENPDGGDSGNENSNQEDINAVIANLSYDPNSLLNVQETGGAASERILTNESSNSTGWIQGEKNICSIKDYDLETNFDDVAIMRPTNGIVYPGALVIGDQGMLDGAPNPLTLDRSPMTLRLDLPGIGEQGTIIVDRPDNANVGTGLDNALEWWNANAYQDGYVNAANSSYQATTSYASKQFSLDVGLNLEWATGSLASQFNFESNTERKVAAIVFRQVFYTVTMNTPATPAAVFAPTVTKEQAEAAFNSDTPPAYVSSVSYGRLLMVRMESTVQDTSIELDAVLEYAGGKRNAGSLELESKYDEVLKNSSITVVTIGGNAEAASEAISLANIDSGFGALNSVLTGENAVYTRNNPGVPIAYTIRYLKDNSLAKMGYTTDYSVETCDKTSYDHENVDVDNNSIFDVRFRFIYKRAGTNNSVTGNYITVNNGQRELRSPPNGAHDVEVEFQFQDAFVWRALGDPISYNYISSQKCFEITNDFLLRVFRNSRSCN